MEALRRHQDGQLAAAEAGYRAVLREDPAQPDALHLLGLIAYQTGQHQRAVELIGRAVALAPDLAAAHTNLGNALLALGRAAEAKEAQRRALALAPEDPQVLANLGTAHLALREYREAAECYGAALARLPDHPGLHVGRAKALIGAGHLDQAEDAARAAVRAAPEMLEARVLLGNVLLGRNDLAGAATEYGAVLEATPDDFDANTGLGVVLLRAGRAAQSEPYLRAALAARPESALALSNLGAALKAQGRAAEAVPLLRAAVERDPGLSDAHCNLGAALCDLNEPESAIAAFRAAAALSPRSPEPRMNLASALADLCQFRDALVEARAALDLRPDYVPGWSVLGRVLAELGEPEAAIAACDRALELDAGWHEARWNAALPLLRLGRYERGWREYESRFDAWPRKLRRPPTEAPRWRGEPLDGRTLLVYWEQGFGDTIHFARYVPMLAARGARVLLQVQQPLRRLFEGFPGVAELVDPDATGVAADYRVALMSLPHLFGTTLDTIPGRVPYLRAPDEIAPRLRLAPSGRRRVGVAWFGSPGQTNNRIRSIPLAELAPLFRLPGIDWYSLQVGPAASELDQVDGGDRVTDLAPLLSDFADTAAVMAQLDLVLTIDTAVAHLAGALARPTWIMLAHVCCWRYLLDRTDSPWYPTARLFRQPAPGDWPSLVAGIRSALMKEISP